MRLWHVRFEVYQKLKTFPLPGDLVEEVQTKPEYQFDGRLRKGMDGAQLSYTLAGEGVFKGPNGVTRLLPGRAFLANHLDPKHAYYYPQHGTKPWVFLWISLHGKIVEKMVQELNSRYGYIYTLPCNSGIIRSLQAYKNYRGTIQALTPLAGSKIVMDIFTSLGETFEKEQAHDPHCSLVRKTQQTILENLEKSTGITEIATKLQVSREHLSRTFKKQTGVSPIEYILHKKMRFASHLLRDTRLSCKEVAERLGYENYTSFMRAFKNIIHVTPKQFREIEYISSLET